jgi:two-component sensor histidine kinase
MSRESQVTIEFAPQVRFLLLHELNHRINNEFSSAISAVSLAAAHSSNSEVKLALSAVGELLHSYADVHRALQVPDAEGVVDAAAYLRKLCLSVSRSKLDRLEIHLVLKIVHELAKTLNGNLQYKVGSKGSISLLAFPFGDGAQ